ncbi:MAG: TIGR01777 family protein [Brevundimonas sp.]|nr:MAG: TIGR01777 family protein [Brevundimonas sp.]
MSDLLWILLTLQIAMGAFDTLYHHELTERLAWKPSQKRELRLHGIRNMIYAALFLLIGWAEPRGAPAIGALILLGIEIMITLTDFVEEDRTRRLPASERVTHTLLALNYGAILTLLAPRLLTWSAEPSAVVMISHGPWSALVSAAAAGVFVFGLRDLAASARSDRLIQPDPAGMGRELPGHRRILVTGATGFIGRRLVAALAGAQHEVIALVRDPAAADLPVPITVVTCLDQLASDTRIDAVVNLAGEPISDSPWTLAKRRRILLSRLKTTRDVRRLIARLDVRPEVLVSGSAIGWYGLHGDQVLDETGPANPCFSHRLCHAWERAANRVEALGVRVVTLRIGLVLGADGGMLSRLLMPFEFGLGGPMGSGRQWMSWIALDDCVRLILHAVADERVAGPLNATAPEPVTNRELSRALGRALHRPALLAAPAAPLRLALGAFADELLLNGQRVVPAKALATGFRFRHRRIDEALAQIVGARPPRATGVTRRERLYSTTAGPAAALVEGNISSRP